LLQHSKNSSHSPIHFLWIADHHFYLLFKAFSPSIPKLAILKPGIQQRGCISLNMGMTIKCYALGKCVCKMFGRIMTGGTTDGVISRQAGLEE